VNRNDEENRKSHLIEKISCQCQDSTLKVTSFTINREPKKVSWLFSIIEFSYKGYV